MIAKTPNEIAQRIADLVVFMNTNLQHEEPVNRRLFEAQYGRKYVRIVAKNVGNGTFRPGGGSCFMFVQLDNGDILKSAGWDAPAKNGARGNIFDDNFGYQKAFGVYGAAYKNRDGSNQKGYGII